MPIHRREYVTRKGLDDNRGVSTLFDLDGRLRPFYDAGKLGGYHVARFDERDDILDEDVEMDVIVEAVEGKFPAIWLVITYESEMFSVDEQIGSILAEFELREI